MRARAHTHAHTHTHSDFLWHVLFSNISYTYFCFSSLYFCSYDTVFHSFHAVQTGSVSTNSNTALCFLQKGSCYVTLPWISSAIGCVRIIMAASQSCRCAWLKSSFRATKSCRSTQRHRNRFLKPHDTYLGPLVFWLDFPFNDWTVFLCCVMVLFACGCEGAYFCVPSYIYGFTILGEIFAYDRDLVHP